MAPPKQFSSSKGQKLSLADIANMVPVGAWADEEVDLQLPTAPTGAQRGGPLPTVPSGGYRPGRGPSMGRNPLAPPDLSKIPTTGPFCLHLSNLPFTVNDALIRSQLFSGYQVVECRLPMEGGKSRGFGYVTVSTADEMKRALAELHGRDFGGRSIRLDVAEQKTGGGGDWRSMEQRKFEDRPGRRPDNAIPTAKDWRGDSGKFQAPSPAPTSSSSHNSEHHGDWRKQSSSSLAPPPMVHHHRSSSKDRQKISFSREDFGKNLSVDKSA